MLQIKICNHFFFNIYYDIFKLYELKLYYPFVEFPKNWNIHKINSIYQKWYIKNQYIIKYKEQYIFYFEERIYRSNISYDLKLYYNFGNKLPNEMINIIYQYLNIPIIE
jgi:hypothetical protein